MDQEKTDRFISLAFTIGQYGGVLLLGLYILEQIYSYGWIPFLTSTAAWLVLALILLLVWVGASAMYHAYLKSSGHANIFPDEERMKDPVEDTLDLSLPYEQAFDICMDAVSSLTVGKILSADREKGVIKGWVSRLVL